MKGTCGGVQFECDDGRQGKVRITTAEGSTVSVPMEALAEFVARTWCLSQIHERIAGMSWMQMLQEEPPAPKKKKA